MGTAAGFGQSMGGQTGVGSASTQTGQTGGKGGGFGTPTSAQNPYASSQPQTQQTPAQPYQPLGGNAYGYNMARLARQMDPSATLPTRAPTPESIYTPQPAQEFSQPSYGGKGGGMGGYGDYFGFGPQPPQFFGEQPQGQYRTQVEPYDPFNQGYDARMERLDALERQYQDLIQRAQNQPRDTGEVIADLPEAFEEFGVGQSPAETAAEQTAAANPPTPAPTPIARDAARAQAKTQGIRGAGSMNAQQLANKLGVPITNARGQVIQPQTAEQQQAARLNPLGGPTTPNSVATSSLANMGAAATAPANKPATTTLAGAREANAPAPTPAPAPVPAPAVPSPAPTAQTKAAAVTAAKESGVKGAGSMSAQQLANAIGAPVVNAKGQTVQPKKAVGGVIHKGMTSNLKKMLKNK